MAEECRNFALDPRRPETALTADQVSIRVAVIVPAPKMMSIVPFWVNPGMGVSSRMAEEGLENLELLREVPVDSAPPVRDPSPAHEVIRERIAGLLERAPLGPGREKKVQPGDVYLFPTGMGAIYGVHRFLLKQQDKKSVLFGFPFHSTVHVFEDIGPGSKLFGKADDEDLAALETYLEEEAKEGRGIQALYTEFPENPVLYTPDLVRLRQLADKYGFALVVDDTIGSFCNVDVLGVADIVVTSLTKSFSGYADVIAGSAVLNPSSRMYASLKPLFEASYTNEFFNADAEVLEKNSRDYLSRSKTLNSTALRLVEYLHSKTLSPSSGITKVLYPTLHPSLPHYQKFMRPATAGFTPGYGCLFSVEFASAALAKTFYDNLNVYHGPHLGAHLTLALPYVMAMYGHEHLDWVGPFGMHEAQIRVSVGLEDAESLIEDFEVAVQAAERAGVA
jgi:cystathionine gamma-synthase